MSDGKDTRFDQLVFSCGGTRWVWQGGLLHVVREAIPLNPGRIAGDSGRATSAAGFIVHRGEMMLDEMRVFAGQDRNFDRNELTNDKDGRTPHQRIYRKVVTKIIGEVQDKTAAGPSDQVLIGPPPATTTPRQAAAQRRSPAELPLICSPHFYRAAKGGLEATLVDARSAVADGRLVNLICAAATIPPTFDIPGLVGRPGILRSRAGTMSPLRRERGRTRSTSPTPTRYEGRGRSESATDAPSSRN